MKTKGFSRFSSLSGRRRRAGSPLELLESRMLLSNSWYVATTGLNSNPGTMTEPFRTIQYAADQAHPGDTVNIFGGVYHETVTVHNSGTAAAPIVFQPYDNETVTIDGADPITGWTQAQGSIWTASMPQDLGTGNNQVFVDDQMVNEARWPNNTLTLSNPTLARITSVVNGQDTSTIYNAAMNQPDGFWVGGYIEIGPGQGWVKQTGVITASGPGWLTFSYHELGADYESPIPKNRYYLFGVAGALDSAGEWFRSSSGVLSLWTPTGDNPANHLVEVKTRMYGFNIAGAAHIHINGINFFACTINTSSASSDVVLNQITDQYLSQFALITDGWRPPSSGIVLAGSGDVLENSTIADSAGDGVFVTGKGVLIENNIIHDIDYLGVDCAPIRLTGSHDVVNGNTLYNAGRDGIFMLDGGKDTITHNLVHDFGLQATDLGGFYCIGRDGGGTVIAYNDFYNGLTGGFGGAGIMFDNNSSNFVVDHNITTNVNIGMRINLMGTNLQIYNNTLNGLDKGLTTLHYGDMTGTVIENNLFVSAPETFGPHSIVSHNLHTKIGFVDIAAGNFNLVAGSPAIGAGMLIPPITNGYTGSAPDLGALPFGQPDFSVGVNATLVPTLPPFIPAVKATKTPAR